MFRDDVDIDSLLGQQADQSPLRRLGNWSGNVCLAASILSSEPRIRKRLLIVEVEKVLDNARTLEVSACLPQLFQDQLVTIGK